MTRCSQILHTNGPDGTLERYKRPGVDMWRRLHDETLAEAANLLNSEEDRRKLLQSVYSNEEARQNVLDLAGEFIK